MTWLYKASHFFVVKVLRDQGRPEKIPGGLALGVFVGFAFPPGVQTVIAVALSPLLRVSPIAAAIAVWVTNPFTIPFIYATSLYLGSLITDLPLPRMVPTEDEKLWRFITDWRTHSRTIMLLWVGLVTLGGIASFITFYLARVLVWLFKCGLERGHHREGQAKSTGSLK